MLALALAVGVVLWKYAAWRFPQVPRLTALPGIVPIFVGLKMAWLNEAFGGKFPVSWSLAIIAALIGGAIVASLLVRRTDPRKGG
ncbi:MAG: hypothetical protein ACM3JH_09145 [Acidithiobacillales bacterium]